ncbi:MAG: cation-translocating P-type ATPase [Bacteriovoracaceae bacterium]
MDKIEHSWTLEKDELLKKLQVDQNQGLSLDQIEFRLQKFGKNSFIKDKKTKKIIVFLKQLKSPMTYTLAVATLISVLLGEWINAIAIFFIVLINSFIGYFQELKAKESIDALKTLSTPEVKVLRQGNIQNILSENIVPGDILVLEAGDYIVADARILESYQLMAQESSLTGESIPVHKHDSVLSKEVALGDRSNLLFAGTAVLNGSGKAIVIGTGINTELGKIADLLESMNTSETPLQRKLTKVSNKLLYLGFIVTVVVISIGLLKGEDLFSIFMAAISLAVAAIPEGLPTVVTIALALAVRRMSKRNAIIRKLSAVETLGAADVICTDKTGTLTTGEMTVRKFNSLNDEQCFNTMIFCNNASIKMDKVGDPTEIALLAFANMHTNIEQIRNSATKIHEWSFDSNRKKMSVAIKYEQSIKLFCKGAPEAVLSQCHNSSKEILNQVQQLSHEGNRVLVLAYKEINENDIARSSEEIETDLTYIGLVAIADPPKKEVFQSIKNCQNSGIRVVMITGDHPLTAKAIALELGIIQVEDHQVLTGLEIDQMSFNELREKVESTYVYARVNPEHKLNIIQALQMNGHTVAMTGDGVNDAPALKKAAIGVSMGKGGTEVARQASSMILTDDNFTTIISAIEEGRAIHGNIKRTIQYLLSTNLAEILIMLMTVILGLPLPLTPLSLLWINLITDGFPALALASEPVEKDFLLINKRPTSSSFFDKAFVIELLFVSLLMTVLSIGIYQWALLNYNVNVARTYLFNFMVYSILTRAFSSRSDHTPVFKLKVNYYLILSISIPILLQLIFQKFEKIQFLFGIGHLSFIEHVILFCISLLPILFIEFKKIYYFQKKIKDL